MAMKSVEKISKSNKKTIPKGATVVKTETRVSVEEIENGFIITKNEETQYHTKERGNDWNYNTTKYFSKEDPFAGAEKPLADIFDSPED